MSARPPQQLLFLTIAVAAVECSYRKVPNINPGLLEVRKHFLVD